MTRNEHVAWCKQRALAELEEGAGPIETRAANALASMTSDLGKHPDTAGHTARELGTLLAMGGHLQTEQQVREWIGGIR